MRAPNLRGRAMFDSAGSLGARLRDTAGACFSLKAASARIFGKRRRVCYTLNTVRLGHAKGMEGSGASELRSWLT